MIPTETRPRNGFSKMRDALLWAILAAVLLELGINFAMERTLWQRIGHVEQELDQVQHELAPQAKP